MNREIRVCIAWVLLAFLALFLVDYGLMFFAGKPLDVTPSSLLFKLLIAGVIGFVMYRRIQKRKHNA